MSLREIFYIFTEGRNKRKVVWFKSDYEIIRDGHGESHTASHPEVETHFEVVKKAIEATDAVKQDTAYKNRKCYYTWFTGDGTYKNQHMKVVLKERFYGKLIVITAYFTPRFKEGEITIWNRIQNKN